MLVVNIQVAQQNHIVFSRVAVANHFKDFTQCVEFFIGFVRVGMNVNQCELKWCACGCGSRAKRTDQWFAMECIRGIIDRKDRVRHDFYCAGIEQKDILFCAGAST